MCCFHNDVTFRFIDFTSVTIHYPPTCQRAQGQRSADVRVAWSCVKGQKLNCVSSEVLQSFDICFEQFCLLWSRWLCLFWLLSCWRAAVKTALTEDSSCVFGHSSSTTQTNIELSASPAPWGTCCQHQRSGLFISLLFKITISCPPACVPLGSPPFCMQQPFHPNSSENNRYHMLLLRQGNESPILEREVVCDSQHSLPLCSTARAQGLF